MSILKTLLLAIGLSSSAMAQSADVPVEDEPTEHVGPECRRQIGVSIGMVFPTDGWDLLGSGPVFTGSPTLSLGCHLGPVKVLGTEVRPFGRMTTAPLQRHWYRDLGQAGLYVMPSFGLTFGHKALRYSIHTVMMPRVIGVGGSLQLRFKGREGNWLTHERSGAPKGFDLTFQVLDGDLVQYQMLLSYTFGVNEL